MFDTLQHRIHSLLSHCDHFNFPSIQHTLVTVIDDWSEDGNFSSFELLFDPTSYWNGAAWLNNNGLTVQLWYETHKIYAIYRASEKQKDTYWDISYKDCKVSRKRNGILV